jgi:LysM repeat protein
MLKGIPTARRLVIASAAALGLSALTSADANTLCGDSVRVRSGDTLAEIGARCGLSVEAVLALNPQIRDPDRIDRGMLINLPGGPMPPAAAQRLEPEPVRQASGTIDLISDLAAILRLSRAAGTIVIGNPVIADATISDEGTLVLTGKAPGTTNLVVFDKNGAELLNRLVRVSSQPPRPTTIFYGARRQTFACVPGHCEPALTVGDEAAHFNEARAQIQAKQELGGQAASSQ